MAIELTGSATTSDREERAAASDGDGPPMSVGFVSPGWPPETVANGVVMYTSDTTRSLRRMGHVTTILAPVTGQGGDGEGLYDLIPRSEARTFSRRLLYRLWYQFDAWGATQLRLRDAIVDAALQAIDERGLQILEMEEAFGLSRLVAARLPIPVVVRLHGPWFLNGTVLGLPQDAEFRRRDRRERAAIVGAAGVTSSSRDVLARTREYYGIPLEGVEAIPPPAPVVSPADRWSPAGCEPGLVVFVGRFDRHKGGDVILDAFAEVARRFPQARLEFVGPDRGVVDDAGRSWSIADYIRERLPGAVDSGRVAWLGQKPIDQLNGFRKRASVVVVPSRYDNLPTTVLEASAQGCPLVATRIGGIPEIVTNGQTGLLCNPGDPADLADKISTLLADRPLAERLAANAGKDCFEQFHPDRLAARMAAFYRRVIQQTSTRR